MSFLRGIIAASGGIYAGGGGPTDISGLFSDYGETGWLLEAGADWPDNFDEPTNPPTVNSPYLTFDGTNDRLYVDGSSIGWDDDARGWDSGHCSIVFAARAPASSGDRVLYAETQGTGNTHWILGHQNNNGRARMRAVSDTGTEMLNVFSTDTAFDNTWHIISAFLGTSTWKMRIDGGSWDSGSYTRSSALSAFIGTLGCRDRTAIDNFYDGDLLPLILITASLSDTDFGKCEARAAELLGL